MSAIRSDQPRQFAVAVFVSQRADDLLGILLALDTDEASAVQQAFEFARDAWGRDPASLHYVAAEHGAPPERPVKVGALLALFLGLHQQLASRQLQRVGDLLQAHDRDVPAARLDLRDVGPVDPSRRGKRVLGTARLPSEAFDGETKSDGQWAA